MPKKNAKQNKRSKRLLNIKLNREGRTSKQVARLKRKKERKLNG